MNGILQADEVSYQYPGMSREVLTKITFSACPGESVILLGPNGTGKSTLLKCLAGLLLPTNGKISLHGSDISKMQRYEVAKKIGFVPQSQVSPFPYLVEEIVLMGRASHLGLLKNPGADDEKRATEALDTVGISHLAKRPCSNLSGGEWQLVLIARAIAQEPEILLLDEPTSHLDLGNQMKVLRVIKKLRDDGMCIVIATHYPDHAFITADRVTVLKEQSMIHDGRPDLVITSELMLDVYGVSVELVHLNEPINRKVCVPLWDTEQNR